MTLGVLISLFLFSYRVFGKGVTQKKSITYPHRKWKMHVKNSGFMTQF